MTIGEHQTLLKECFAPDKDFEKGKSYPNLLTLFSENGHNYQIEESDLKKTGEYTEERLKKRFRFYPENYAKFKNFIRLKKLSQSCFTA
jgi:hypothetical protein